MTVRAAESGTLCVNNSNPREMVNRHGHSLQTATRAGERVVDIGCGCGAPTLEFARAVGPSGRVTGFDISGPMLAEGERRASAARITNVDWRHVDPATAALDEYDILDDETNDPVLTQLTPRQFQTGDLIVEPLLNQD